MKMSAPHLKRESNVKKERQVNNQSINKTLQGELINKATKDKIVLADITKEQWFWDTSVPS